MATVVKKSLALRSGGCLLHAMRILIVEDERQTAAYLQKGLSESGFVVDVTHRGDNGLHLARTQYHDLIILDVTLPGLDGWSVLAAIRQWGKQTPALFLTARDTVADRVKGFELRGGAGLLLGSELLPVHPATRNYPKHLTRQRSPRPRPHSSNARATA